MAAVKLDLLIVESTTRNLVQRERKHKFEPVISNMQLNLCMKFCVYINKMLGYRQLFSYVIG